MTTSYTIVTGGGGELSAGISSEHEARQIAQRHANSLGEAVYVSGPEIPMDPDDDDDIGEAIEPCPDHWVHEGRCRSCGGAE